MDKCIASYVLKILQKPYIKHHGICSRYIWHMYPEPAFLTQELMVECCNELGIYSGDYAYPISHPWFSARLAFNIPFNKWSRFTIYGRRRRRVRKLMIKKLKEILDE